MFLTRAWCAGFLRGYQSVRTAMLNLIANATATHPAQAGTLFVVGHSRGASLVRVEHLMAVFDLVGAHGAVRSTPGCEPCTG